MYPVFLGTLPVYSLMWAVAVTVCLVLGARIGVAGGLPAGRSAMAIALLASSILIGSKLLYLTEAWLSPHDDYVPQVARGLLHGFRIPGGMLALAVAMPLVCRVLRLPWRRFGDAVIPLAALALVFIRLGCFLNSCCFGKVTSVPWAVSFPRGSWVHWYHKTHGWIALTAEASLPVHPLQLYFVVAAAVTLAILRWPSVRSSRSPALSRESPGVRAGYPGERQLLFHTLFFGSTALLEPLRENYLTLNNWLAAAAALVAAGLWLLAAQERGVVAILRRALGHLQ